MKTTGRYWWGPPVFGIAALCTAIWAVSLWTDRNLEFYLSLIKGEPVEVPYWISLVTTIILNAIIVVVNIIGEIVRLAL